MATAEFKVHDGLKQTAVFHQILVATDFSDTSRRAVGGASSGSANDAELSVVHVPHSDWRYEMLGNPPELDLERTDVQCRLEDLIASLHAERKIDANLLKPGPVAMMVSAAASKESADLVVVGTRGLGGFASWHWVRWLRSCCGSRRVR
jgi:nucleotide-binding universal stress UspA family protein